MARAASFGVANLLGFVAAVAVDFGVAFAEAPTGCASRQASAAAHAAQSAPESFVFTVVAFIV
jgi:hypothetical protein